MAVNHHATAASSALTGLPTPHAPQKKAATRLPDLPNDLLRHRISALGFDLPTHAMRHANDYFRQKNDGPTALMCAAMQGHTANLQALLQASAGVENTYAHGMAALMPAARVGYAGTAQALCRAGANCTRANKQEEPALDLATRNGMRVSSIFSARTPRQAVSGLLAHA